MSWVCGYCGTENVNDDRVGREEPLCRKCKKERIDPNGLQKKRDEEIKEIEQELKRVNGVIDDISCEIEDLES